MVRVDAASRTEIMSCHLSIELIKRQFILTFDNPDMLQNGCPGYRTATTTKRAIASTRRHNAIWQRQLNLDITTMADKPVFFLDQRVANSFYHYTYPSSQTLGRALTKAGAAIAILTHTRASGKGPRRQSEGHL
jgi:hypothetical protein